MERHKPIHEEAVPLQEIVDNTLRQSFVGREINKLSTDLSGFGARMDSNEQTFAVIDDLFRQRVAMVDLAAAERQVRLLSETPMTLNDLKAAEKAKDAINTEIGMKRDDPESDYGAEYTSVTRVTDALTIQYQKFIGFNNTGNYPKEMAADACMVRELRSTRRLLGYSLNIPGYREGYK